VEKDEREIGKKRKTTIANPRRDSSAWFLGGRKVVGWMKPYLGEKQRGKEGARTSPRVLVSTAKEKFKGGGGGQKE